MERDRERERRRRWDRSRESQDERRSASSSSVSLSSSSMAIKLWKCYQSRVSSGACVLVTGAVSASGTAPLLSYIGGNCVTSTPAALAVLRKLS